MAKRRKSKKKKTRPSMWRSLADMDPQRRRRWLVSTGVGVIVVALIGGIGLLQSRLEAHVNALLHERVDMPTLNYVDLPENLASLVLPDLESAMVTLLEGDWLADDLCQRLAKRIASVGWVKEVKSVRRCGDGSFAVRADYRVPAALVGSGDRYDLIDNVAVRLPGMYLPSDQWKIIVGVAAAPPLPGHSWVGEDIRVGLALIRLLQGEPYSAQVRGVDVRNVGGRSDKSESHVVVQTVREGGHILWGSAPGAELVENSAQQKLAILRANYRQTGWLDAGYKTIDVTTFPDRFTIP